MSWKKKKKNVKKVKRTLYLLVGFVIVLILLLAIFLFIKLLDKGNYYDVQSRLNNVRNAEVIENSSYRTVGWLRVQGTDLDLPIVYSDDIYEEFPMQLEDFVWLDESDTKFHNVVKINGHNLYNLSSSPKLKSKKFHRFEELMSFVYYDFAKENKYIQLTLNGKEYVYKIFFAGFIDDSKMTSLSLIQGDYSDEDISELLDINKEDNLYKYNVDVNKKDKIISLSTCTRFFGQDEDVTFYVNGRLLRSGEKINDYKVTKSNVYKKVEKVLKGDDDNEEDTL